MGTHSTVTLLLYIFRPTCVFNCTCLNGFSLKISAVCAVILLVCGFCIRRCFRKRRAKDGKKGKGVVDLKSVQLLGSAYKEKVCGFEVGLVCVFMLRRSGMS